MSRIGVALTRGHFWQLARATGYRDEQIPGLWRKFLSETGKLDEIERMLWERRQWHNQREAERQMRTLFRDRLTDPLANAQAAIQKIAAADVRRRYGISGTPITRHGVTASEIVEEAIAQTRETMRLADVKTLDDFEKVTHPADVVHMGQPATRHELWVTQWELRERLDTIVQETNENNEVVGERTQKALLSAQEHTERALASARSAHARLDRVEEQVKQRVSVRIDPPYVEERLNGLGARLDGLADRLEELGLIGENAEAPVTQEQLQAKLLGVHQVLDRMTERIDGITDRFSGWMEKTSERIDNIAATVWPGNHPKQGVREARIEALREVDDIKVVEVHADGSAHLWSPSRNLEWDARPSNEPPMTGRSRT